MLRGSWAGTLIDIAGDLMAARVNWLPSNIGSLSESNINSYWITPNDSRLDLTYASGVVAHYTGQMVEFQEVDPAIKHSTCQTTYNGLNFSPTT